MLPPLSASGDTAQQAHKRMQSAAKGLLAVNWSGKGAQQLLCINRDG